MTLGSLIPHSLEDLVDQVGDALQQRSGAGNARDELEAPHPAGGGRHRDRQLGRMSVLEQQNFVSAVTQAANHAPQEFTVVLPIFSEGTTDARTQFVSFDA